MAGLDDMVDEIAEELDDEANYGMSKKMLSFELTRPDGSELPDLLELMRSGGSIDELQAFLDERMQVFNSLPIEQRKAVTDPMFERSTPEAVELPFLFVPPSAAEVEQSARESTLLLQVDGFVRDVATTGVKLTQAGNIGLADANRLVELLRTGDDVNRPVGIEKNPIRSSLRLRWLMLIVDVAEMVGAVTRLKTKFRADPEWLEQPIVERATDVVSAVFELGPLGSRPWETSPVFGDVEFLLDGGVPHWLVELLPVGVAAEFDDFVVEAQRVVADTYPDFARRFGGSFERMIARDVSESFEVLRRIGIVDWVDRHEVQTPFFGVSHNAGGKVSLTALGRHTLPDELPEAGYLLHSIGDLAGADVMVVLGAVATQSVSFDEALERWQPDASPEMRARLLADGAVQADHPSLRLAAFALLGQLEPAVAVGPAVRELLDTPVSGYAATLLLDRGLATLDEIGMFISIGPLVDLLYTIIDEPELLDEMFRSVQAQAIDDLIDDMWRCDQPETLELLEALGRHVTDKQLAKSARKAAIKHRSWLANQGR